MPIPTGSSTTARQTTSGPVDSQSAAAAAGATGAGVDSGAGTTRQKTEAEREADRLYEERMEEEYAKREGGS
ncbi:hypothetical protein QBC33DRAFT_558673 [Phialemonium atrogriseum]|uniref:Uncharacterized protein n=1 Tax=Phialemonium atrogriseum TaxID=1093897 RepID=A0AAJ0C0F8_9PEZI|nr:uncharacterized protein QBC33DRAFT_558673 [Phialemonium atrogriseum]KAK1767844.1 hypothetical protein QBC33DRAFT_558673 [Phialemonium atrogriseum]